MIIVMVGALIGIVLFIAFLLEFVVASRHDPLTEQAESAACRRARQAAGMYVRR